jgi:predicted transcriptional regulator
MTQTTSGSSHTARALSLLGSGVSTEATAAALGVTPSAISQLLANDTFAEEVTHLRYTNLQAHNKRDNKYDSLEDALIQKLEDSLGLIMRPEMILRAMATVNAAKRRGQSTPEQVSESATVLTLVLPAQIIQKFTTNINNQVIRAGDQSLHTIPSSSLVKQLEASQQEAALLSDLGETSEHQIEATS